MIVQIKTYLYNSLQNNIYEIFEKYNIKLIWQKLGEKKPKKPKGSIKEAPLEILQSPNRSDGIVKIM